MAATVTASEPMTVTICRRASGWMNGSVLCASGVRPSSPRTRMMALQTSIPADSQNGNAPPPGPMPGRQPMGSSVLFHIR